MDLSQLGVVKSEGFLFDWGSTDLPKESLAQLVIGDLVRVSFQGGGPYFVITEIEPNADPEEIVFTAIYGWIYEIPLEYDFPELRIGQSYRFKAKYVYEIPKPILLKKHLMNQQHRRLFPKTPTSAKECEK